MALPEKQVKTGSTTVSRIIPSGAVFGIVGVFLVVAFAVTAVNGYVNTSPPPMVRSTPTPGVAAVLDQPVSTPVWGDGRGCEYRQDGPWLAVCVADYAEREVMTRE